MCGAEGARPPRCRTSRPFSYRGAASSSPDTSWDEADASTVTAPPGSEPVPCTVNGMAPRPPSSMTAPSSRSAAMIAPTGRWAARGSPWNPTATLPSAATGGTKRITVPALPTSTLVSLAGPAGGDQPGPAGRRCPPGRPGRAARWPSAACPWPAAGAGPRPGPAASAASTSARLVIDLEPGSRHLGPDRAGRLRGQPDRWRGFHAVSVMRGLRRPRGVNQPNQGKNQRAPGRWEPCQRRRGPGGLAVQVWSTRLWLRKATFRASPVPACPGLTPASSGRRS